MKQNICNKCGWIIEGTEVYTQGKLKGRIGKKKVPLLPWHVEITTKHWKGYEFDLCEKCKKELLKSLKHPAETYDC